MSTDQNSYPARRAKSLLSLSDLYRVKTLNRYYQLKTVNRTLHIVLNNHVQQFLLVSRRLIIRTYATARINFAITFRVLSIPTFKLLSIISIVRLSLPRPAAALATTAKQA